MATSALVIGYGSIGKRHAVVLDEMDDINSIVILSNQSDLPYFTITKIEDIPVLNPDYIIVACPTAQHYSHLVFLEENLESKKILVEKPLFEAYHFCKINNNQVYVGYNLRFHPLLQKIKEFIRGKKLWNIHVFCGSYLPEWRPDKDYRQTSSVRKDYGGGVLLDLSHELDYIQWLVGSIEVDHVVNEKVSDLEIETDDLLLLSGQTEDSVHLHVSLNYFTRKPLRQILIEGKDISIRADLVENILSVVEMGKTNNYSWTELERNQTYRAQHQAILDDDLSWLCTYEEGLETMHLIDNIRSFNN